MSQAQYTTAVSLASTKLLVAFHNDHSASPPVKKFADRQTAERRCLKLVQDLINAAPDGRKEEARLILQLQGAAPDDLAAIQAAGLAHPLNIEAAHREITSRAAEGEDMTGATVDPVTSAIVKPAPDDTSSISHFSVHGLTHCPSCGIHLSNGIGEDKQEVNGKIIRHDTHQFACLGCGAEFGPAIRRRSPAPSTDRSAAIAASWTDPDVKAARSERSHVSVGKQTFRSVRDAFVHLGLPLEKHIKFRGQLKAAGTLAYGDHTFTIVAQQAL